MCKLKITVFKNKHKPKLGQLTCLTLVLCSLLLKHTISTVCVCIGAFEVLTVRSCIICIAATVLLLRAQKTECNEKPVDCRLHTCTVLNSV